jgi:hypothetical protein
VSEEERGVLDRQVKGGVVGEHQRSNVVLPIQDVFTDHVTEVVCNRLIGDLSLAVALRVIGSHGGVLDVEEREELVGELRAELLSLVCDYLQRAAKSAAPTVLDGLGNGGGIF